MKCQNCDFSSEDVANELHYCQICDNVTCDPCYQEIHKHPVMKHGAPLNPNIMIYRCKDHSSKRAEFVCKDCEMTMCAGCTIAHCKECKESAIMEFMEFVKLSRETIDSIKPQLLEVNIKLKENHDICVGNIKKVRGFIDLVDSELDDILSKKRKIMKDISEGYYSKQLLGCTNLETEFQELLNANEILLSGKSSEEFDIKQMRTFKRALQVSNLQNAASEPTECVPVKHDSENGPVTKIFLNLNACQPARKLARTLPNTVDSFILGTYFVDHSREKVVISNGEIGYKILKYDFGGIESQFGPVRKQNIELDSHQHFFALTKDNISFYFNSRRTGGNVRCLDMNNYKILIALNGKLSTNHFDSECIVAKDGDPLEGEITNTEYAIKDNENAVIVGTFKADIFIYSNDDFTLILDGMTKHKHKKITGPWNGYDIIASCKNLIFAFCNETKNIKVFRMADESLPEIANMILINDRARFSFSVKSMKISKDSTEQILYLLCDDPDSSVFATDISFLWKK